MTPLSIKGTKMDKKTQLIIAGVGLAFTAVFAGLVARNLLKKDDQLWADGPAPEPTTTSDNQE